MRRHFKIKISGKVQGVFFRASTKEKADALNISGFVRNQRDGSVYVEAEGDEENLKQFILWCQDGPDHARVDQCEVHEGELTAFSGFVIEW